VVVEQYGVGRVEEEAGDDDDDDDDDADDAARSFWSLESSRAAAERAFFRTREQRPSRKAVRRGKQAQWIVAQPLGPIKAWQKKSGNQTFLGCIASGESSFFPFSADLPITFFLDILAARLYFCSPKHWQDGVGRNHLANYQPAILLF
jgi:hypothetical protein